MLWKVLFVLPFLVYGQANDDEVVDSFSEIDMNELEDLPVKIGFRLWDERPERYKKVTKSLGKSFNLGLWPTLWEVSSAAPAPWYADDERMDLWIGTVYRNLYNKHDSMRNASSFFGNNSIEIIGKFLGVPEAYSLSIAQKKYREEKAAEEEEREPDLSSFYVNHNGLDPDRIDDLGKFFAASVDHLKGLGVTLPFIELFDEVNNPGEHTLYINSSEVNYLVKKTRAELDARNLLSDEVKIVVPGVHRPHRLKPYLKALAKDKDAYDKLYALSTHFVDNGSLPLTNIERQAIRLRKEIENIIPSDWEKKPVVVTGLRHEGADNVEYNGMRYLGDIRKCYEDKHQRTGHKTLTDSISQSPPFAVRSLASIMLVLSHGFPWIVYYQGADAWWDRSCDGLIDKNDKPKQVLAALETVIPFFTNETYPVAKQWKNYDECFISAFKSTQKNARYIVTVTNYSPKVCERSFSLKGIDLWDIKKGTIITYNNGTVALDADKPYRALIQKKTLSYDIYDEDDGTSVGPEIEFDLTVGPYASATAVIDSKVSKKKRKPKPKKDVAGKKELEEDEEELEIEFDEDETFDDNTNSEVTIDGVGNDVTDEVEGGGESQNQNGTEIRNGEEPKPEHSEL